ncbi:MAG: pseudouridine synthase ribosomal large subunit [Fibrobacterota bacterium]|jgi:23S rRNA pseudouridine2605 synthase
MRINRYLASCGLGSRRACEELVTTGRVALDGVVVRDLATDVGPDHVVHCDGQLVSHPETYHVVLFHKPKGCVCARKDPQGRQTIYDRLPPHFIRLAHVGRLDFASRGLLLLSDDGEIVERLTHPRYEHRKIYRVLLDEPLRKEDREVLTMGGWVMEDGERPLEPVGVKGDGVSIELTLKEGRNRQIRRMMAAFGRDVLDLQRIAVGEWRLAGLEEGAWKLLTNIEWRALRQSLGLSAVPAQLGMSSPAPARTFSRPQKRSSPRGRSR